MERRLKLQRNYEPKLRLLAEVRTRQLGFSELERMRALRSIDALSWKLTVAGIHLERLWENKESFDLQQLVSQVYGSEPDPRRFTDEDIAYLTLEFEAYVIQARALITVAQIHTLDACRQPFGGRLTNEKYEKVVKGAPDDAKDRLVRAHEYFEKSVFGPEKWGTLIRSLRDRVLHFDRVRSTRMVNEEGSEELTVRGLSLEQLAQDYENGTYDLLVDVIAPIWGRDWEAGAYTPGMWEH